MFRLSPLFYLHNVKERMSDYCHPVSEKCYFNHFLEEETEVRLNDVSKSNS